MDKKLKKLSRDELLELMVDLSDDYEALVNENNRLKKMLAEQRSPRSVKVGSIAEAALQANGYFEAAQRSADVYLREIKRLRDEMAKRVDAQALNRELVEKVEAARKAEGQAQAYLRDAQERSSQIVQQANSQAEAILAEARSQANQTIANANRQSHAILVQAQQQAQKQVLQMRQQQSVQVQPQPRRVQPQQQQQPQPQLQQQRQPQPQQQPQLQQQRQPQPQPQPQLQLQQQRQQQPQPQPQRQQQAQPQPQAQPQQKMTAAQLSSATTGELFARGRHTRAAQGQA